MGDSVRRPAGSGSGESPVELWERALKEQPEKVRIFGPPAWLVAQRVTKKYGPHEIAQRIRKELGIER